MVNSLDFISSKGEVMPLLNDSHYVLTGVDGFTSISSNVSSVTVPYVDGDNVTNVQAQPRSLVIYLRLTGDIETSKRYIFRYVKPKVNGTIRLNQDERDIQLSGIVEAIQLPRFEQGCTMQITLHCAQPYWEDVDFVVKEISTILDLHYFPIELGGLAFPPSGVPFGVYDTNQTRNMENNGDVDTGMVITVIALGEVKNPRIYNTLTGDYIGIDDILQGNDEVIINTIKGQKTITKNGVNIIDRITKGSSFLQIEVGHNEFTIDALKGLDNVYFTLTYKQRYV